VSGFSRTSEARAASGLSRTPSVDRHFLIVRLGSLGDVIHGIPTAAALRRTYPHARIDWLVDPRYMELLELVECIDLRIPFDPRELMRRTVARDVLRELRQTKYDAVIDLQGLLKSAMLSRLVRARQTIGFPRQHLREPLARFFYTDTPDPGGARHVIEKNLALVGAVGVTDRRVRFPIAIPRTPTVASARERVGNAEYALLNPGAAWPNKRWPPARFGAIAVALQRDFGLRSLVLWGPGEESLATAVVNSSGGAAQRAPLTTIPDLVGLARTARLMVSGDTGPLHIAGAVGTPLVALFGPTLPERNGPWSPQDVVVSRVAQCSCSYARGCRLAVPCIDDISIDEVYDAIRRRLSPNP
jgi:lipopolysaccharide heptosyltransferase I